MEEVRKLRKRTNSEEKTEKEMKNERRERGCKMMTKKR